MLKGKQRAALRAMANPLDAIFQVGKGQIGDDMLRGISDALEARELIKLRVLENSGITARQAADEISGALGAEVVSVIGHRFVLYRESEKNKKIVLE